MSRQDKFEASEIENVPAGFMLDDDRLQVDLRLKLNEVAELEAELLRRSARRQPSRKELSRLARKIYEARRSRDKILDKEKRGLFGEPAWDMLLALYFMPQRGQFLSVTSLAYVAYVPPTTGIRWHRILIEQGLAKLSPDVDDQRRRFVGLTSRGKALMESYLTKLYYADADRKPEG